MSDAVRPKKASALPGSLGSLLYHAYVIEAEAEARYRELADQMEQHNNPETAALFRQLAEYEAKHAQHVSAHGPAIPGPPLDPWDFSWMGAEAPENIPHGAVHYQLTPREALELSLAAEKAAFRFFDALSASTDDVEVRTLAQTFAADEAEHIQLIEKALAALPSGPVSLDDWDPPVEQE